MSTPTPGQPNQGAKGPTPSPAAGSVNPAAPAQPQPSAKPSTTKVQVPAQANAPAANQPAAPASASTGTPKATAPVPKVQDPALHERAINWAKGSLRLVISVVLGILLLITAYSYRSDIEAFFADDGMPKAPTQEELDAGKTGVTGDGKTKATGTAGTKHIVVIQRGPTDCVIVSSDGEKLGEKALENDRLGTVSLQATNARLTTVEQKTDRLETTVAGHGQTLRHQGQRIDGLDSAVASQQKQLDGKMDKSKVNDIYYSLIRPQRQNQAQQRTQSANGMSCGTP